MLVKSQKQRIKKQLPSGVRLQEIIKDTLFLNVGSLVTKKLAVKADIKIKYHIGYDISEQISLTPGIKNLKFETKEITISGKIEKFTEGTLNIPYKITNLPKGVILNTLDKKIQITYIVGLSNFNKIDENSFQIECDYSISKTNNLGYLIPKLLRKPSEIKSYKMIPNEINFLIQN